MKLVLTLASPDIYKKIDDYAASLGFDTLWYQHILKAMYNLDEVAPNGVVVSAADFPRHWKTFVSFLRISRPASVCPVILLYGDRWTQSDEDKAKFLDVNCLLSEKKIEVKLPECFSSLFRGFLSPEKWLGSSVLSSFNHKKLGLIVTNPFSGALISGKINKISQIGLVFTADHPNLFNNIDVNTNLHGCSLRAGGTILQPVCKIIDKNGDISLEFVDFPDKEKKALCKFLEAASV